jgi:5'-nucleotidase
MRILVTNDDGINSEGLWSLAEALAEVGEVFVVAPDRDRSGVAAAMTLLDIIRAEKIRPPIDGVETYAVQGTPGDCVILANEALFDTPFDIVFSGINQGANIGVDVLLSGTIGAAMHGYLRGISSVAVSTYFRPYGPIRYAAACRAAVAIARELNAAPVSGPLLLNINLPDAEPSDVESVEVTVPGDRAFMETVERQDVGRRTHYWIRHNRVNDSTISDPDVGTDVWAVWGNKASISSIDPLRHSEISAGRMAELADAIGRELDGSSSRISL